VVDATELEEAEAYEELDPPLGDRLDIACILLCRLCNLWRGSGEEPLDPSNLMPWLPKPNPKDALKPQQTPAEMRAVMAGLRAGRR
jgi:hypothetical protein